ncbi:MAG: peptidoglycan bridge formation glycyltransferase FemA/FemB family protein [Patescibacteria group bacterium]
MENNSFLQSKYWEKFQQSVGYKTFRVDNILLIKKPLLLGRNYFYCPRPEIRNQKSEIRNFLDQVKILAEKENIVFLRIEPVDKLPVTRYPLHKVTDIQPSQTIILDLTKSEDELLAQMHPKTRYNIRLAEKHGVKVREAHMSESAPSADEFEKFWKLMEETVGRDGFRSHNKEYYRKMLQVNNFLEFPSLEEGTGVVGNKREQVYSNSSSLKEGNSDAKFFLGVAEYQEKILAAGIFVFYNETVTYLHGASTHEHKEIMAPYALHWEMIKLAKNAGYRYYDLYGVSETKWPGVTRFKKGFGGETVDYPGCYDIVFSKGWYKIYKFTRRLRKLI